MIVLNYWSQVDLQVYNCSGTCAAAEAVVGRHTCGRDVNQHCNPYGRPYAYCRKHVPKIQTDVILLMSYCQTQASIGSPRKARFDVCILYLELCRDHGSQVPLNALTVPSQACCTAAIHDSISVSRASTYFL
jgi:hypothetical protein